MTRTFLAVALIMTGILEPVAAGDNNPEACRAIFSGSGGLISQCLREAPKAKGTPIQLLSEHQLKDFCSRFDDVSDAINCYTEIGWLKHFKGDLGAENKEGLKSEFADRWKLNSQRECGSEATKTAALDCVLLQRSGTLSAYDEANAKAARAQQDADPIVQFCKNAFGAYWEGVERCVKDQRSAKARMGY
ncbi:hypothetical protein [Hansschlegelia zhihuaiae]|uniref:Uncharacterized protein n=1 Tax=Hansschlegelia zhihuaiae TaxID=405005 RepID=A0A4Q0MNV7_9HYPH|nr:hypothetical protein [Hansschlegelia zhihuaiae]RXF75518.1 hypothetical protein EK403_01285 [Hansschlegelia zhihuaiae]